MGSAVAKKLMRLNRWLKWSLSFSTNIRLALPATDCLKRLKNKMLRSNIYELLEGD